MAESLADYHADLGRGFSAALQAFTREQLADPFWESAFPEDPEGYAYHLAFAEAGVDNFRTGLLVLDFRGVRIAAVPVFTTEYQLDATVQGAPKRLTDWLRRRFPRLFGIRLLCVGSAVTDSARLGVGERWRRIPDFTTALTQALDGLAAREGIGLIAFKDVLERDRRWLAAPLKSAGFAELANMPVARNPIRFASLDDYLAGFSAGARKDLRRKWRARQRIEIEEIHGLPPNLAEIHALYLNCYEKSDLKFERLTPAFFAEIARLLAPDCRFVLYREDGRLIGFNLLIGRGGTLVDKYIGMDYDAARQVNLYFLSWLHNIEMCIRDGFHTFQSGQGAYAAKRRLRAELEMTWLYFRHRNPLFNLGLRGLGRLLAYGNFDPALSDA